MLRNYVFYFILLFFLSIICSLHFLYSYKNKMYNNFTSYSKILKQKLLFLISKYKNCNATQSPLNCGHKYEGYKIQKKGLYPQSVIVDLSVYKNIHTLQHVSCDSNELIVGIICAPQQFMERLSLRMGYKFYTNMLLRFFSGLSDNESVNKLLKSENYIYHDIVLFDLVSHYFNSSLMLILEMNWIYKNCKDYKYFIYHTPDVFFNFHLFNKTYLNSFHSYPLIAQILKKNRVLRSNRSRFFIPYSIYNKTHYPPQPNGPLIAFAYYTIVKLIKNIHKVKMSFWMDDVYLAFLLQSTKIRGCNINNAISLYPVQIKKLPNITYIVSKILYIHSLPPASILFLIKMANDYFNSSSMI